MAWVGRRGSKRTGLPGARRGGGRADLAPDEAADLAPDEAADLAPDEAADLAPDEVCLPPAGSAHHQRDRRRVAIRGRSVARRRRLWPGADADRISALDISLVITKI